MPNPQITCNTTTNITMLQFTCKSKLAGLAVIEDELGSFANLLHCQTMHLPFVYLGIPIAASPQSRNLASGHPKVQAKTLFVEAQELIHWMKDLSCQYGTYIHPTPFSLFL